MSSVLLRRRGSLCYRVSLLRARFLSDSKKANTGKYSSTVLLPNTSFDQRANAAKREPEIQKFWSDMGIYEKLLKNNKGDNFVLHDGPPYANGKLHIGHALNKILKDIVNKYHMLNGKRVHYIPGWDCHGLPIELKVLQSLKSSERQNLTPVELRKRAAAFATETITHQKEGFKRYGVWGDWEQPYTTMSKEYEAAQIGVFGEMLSKGYIYRGLKPVHWSPSSHTALAEAELEYPDNHISRSIYVGFDVTQPSAALQSLLAAHSVTARVVVWTTTPWTLPANQAVAVRSDLQYTLVSFPSDSNTSNAKECAFIVAAELLDKFAGVCGLPLSSAKKLGSLSGADLATSLYQHPLYPSRSHSVVIGGDYINTDSGTGLVHTAPGHGAEDFALGQKLNLPLLSPVDDAGKFTMEAGEEYAGLEVLGAGNAAVIEALTKAGYIIKEEAYNHKYPYDWRTKKPTIFRATVQWFASIDSFRDKVQTAIENTQWIPAIGENRISTMIAARRDWCISRQRAWGVPIPVFFHKTTGEVLVSPESIAHIGQVFRERGADAWWELDVKELLPASMAAVAGDYERGGDTMDVWFDSGTSWEGVLRSTGKEGVYPADLYLEGSDQHRGWFQSSLLTAVATHDRPQAPFKAVLTHGFVLDEKGHKMSKSLGNVVDPDFIINGGSNKKTDPAYGADTLRMWVAGVDYTHDICIGSNIVKSVSDNYRKLRNTLRYLIGSLHEFNPEASGVPVEQLPSLDRYMLGTLSRTFQEVDASYSSYQFYRTNQLISHLSGRHLSSFYLDISKDRLYISGHDDFRRRSCQTVLSHILEQLTLMLAPILPHMAEDVWQNYPYPTPTQSIFERGWKQNCLHFEPHREEFWGQVLQLRDDVNHCIEQCRRNKLIGASQECQVFIHIDENDAKFSREFVESVKLMGRGDEGEAINVSQDQCVTNGVDDLRFIFMTSQVQFVSSAEEVVSRNTEVLSMSNSVSGCTVGVSRARGRKCERCWYYSCSVDAESAHSHSDICARCRGIVGADM
jgi:isoleucyl-tRNA synthetase